MLSFQVSVAVHGSVDGLYAPRCLLGLLEGDVNPKGVRLPVRTFPVADGDFLDVAVLPEELGFPQRLKQLVFSNGRRQSGDVHEVLLYDANTNQISAVLLLSLSLLGLFLSLLLGSLPLALLDVRAKLGYFF